MDQGRCLPSNKDWRWASYICKRLCKWDATYREHQHFLYDWSCHSQEFQGRWMSLLLCYEVDLCLHLAQTHTWQPMHGGLRVLRTLLLVFSGSSSLRSEWRDLAFFLDSHGCIFAWGTWDTAFKLASCQLVRIWLAWCCFSQIVYLPQLRVYIRNLMWPLS